jgi:hypothetical protein
MLEITATTDHFQTNLPNPTSNPKMFGAMNQFEG